MATIFDYLETEFARFDARPFGVVDAAILSQACMFDAAGLVSAPEDAPRLPRVLARALSRIAPGSALANPGARFADLQRAECYQGMFLGLTPGDLKRLLAALVANPRFRDLRLRDYRSVFDEASHTQFAAMTVTWGDDFAYVGFRGTDTSIVGWRENFDMAYRPVVCAQELARAYLDEVAPHLPERLFVGGHSKGGNLAAYAALTCSDAVRERIARVWCHDAPGFPRGRWDEDELARLAGRIDQTVPQDSVVGMLMDFPAAPRTVRSTATGVDQHSPFTWEIEDGDFVYLERPNASALALHDTIDEWLAGMDAERTEEVVDALFAAIEASGVQDASALLGADADPMRAIREAARNIDPASRDVLNRALGALAGIAARRAGRELATAFASWLR